MSKEIIDKLQDQYFSYLDRMGNMHNEHILRVERAIGWFNLQRISEPPAQEMGYLKVTTKDDVVEIDAALERAMQVKSDFVGSKLKIDGVKCVCVYADLGGTPNFNATFRMRPLQADEDLGTGCGSMKQYDF
jgi:hypothetical protein